MHRRFARAGIAVLECPGGSVRVAMADGYRLRLLGLMGLGADEFEPLLIPRCRSDSYVRDEGLRSTSCGSARNERAESNRRRGGAFASPLRAGVERRPPRRTVSALELAPAMRSGSACGPARPSAVTGWTVTERRNFHSTCGNSASASRISIRARSFVVVPQLRIVMFLYSGFPITLPMRLSWPSRSTGRSRRRRCPPTSGRRLPWSPSPRRRA